MVCELLLEESNVQPVSTPVTVCGDIHGQVSQFYCAFIDMLKNILLIGIGTSILIVLTVNVDL